MYLSVCRMYWEQSVCTWYELDLTVCVGFEVCFLVFFTWSELQGLVVPVLRNVENMNYAQIEHAIAELGKKVSDLVFLIKSNQNFRFSFVGTKLCRRCEAW